MPTTWPITWPITWDDVVAARARIAPYLSPTPLRRYPVLDEELGVRVLVKHENHLPTNAFKARNTLSFMTALPAEQRARGVVAATRGNHGAGLAWAGAALGVPVVICVPLGNNPEKNAAIRGHGAELVAQRTLENWWVRPTPWVRGWVATRSSRSSYRATWSIYGSPGFWKSRRAMW